MHFHIQFHQYFIKLVVFSTTSSFLTLCYDSCLITTTTAQTTKKSQIFQQHTLRMARQDKTKRIIPQTAHLPTAYKHSLHWVGFILALLLLVVGDGLPAERQAPVKVATVVCSSCGHGLVELKGVEVDGHYLWADHRSWLFHNTGQQGLQPAVKAFTWNTMEHITVAHVVLMF